MSYASPEYDYDIFISYARLDNQSETPETKGWVTFLYERIKFQLMQKLGLREGVEIFFDDSEIVFKVDEFKSKVKKSAIMIVISSPAYFEPGYISREEFDAFMSTSPDMDRLIVVECLPLLSQSQYPSSLANSLRNDFTIRDGATVRPLSVSGDTNIFIKRAWDLVEKLAYRINEFRNAHHSSNKSVDLAPKARPLLVCQVTEDLAERRGDLIRYLKQFNVPIVTESEYPSNGEAFQNQYIADLTKCDAAVQLLSALPGRIYSGMQEPYTFYQFNTAKAKAKPILQWRSDDLSLYGVRDSDQLSLLKGENVRATGFEEFKRYLSQWATQVEPDRHKSDSSLIFINADSIDLDIATRLQSAFSRLNIATALPLQSLGEGVVTAQAARRDLEDNLRECDIIIYVYRDAPTEWIRGQLRQFNKICSHREVEPRIIAICFGSADSKNKVGMSVPRFREVIINDLNEDTLFDVAKELVQ